MSKKHFVAIFYVITIAVASLLIIQFATPLNPYGIVGSVANDFTNISMDYTAPTNFVLSNATLAVTGIQSQCTITGFLKGSTNVGTTVALAGDGQYSYLVQQSLASSITGNLISQFTVQESLACPIGTTPVVLRDGYSVIDWQATKSDSTKVDVIINKKPISVAQLPTTVGSSPIILATWVLNTSDIENAIGSSLGNSYQFQNQIIISNYLNFYQSQNTATVYSLSNADNLISFNLKESTSSPLALSVGAVTLTITNPKPASINLNNYQLVTLDGSVAGWQQSQGYPELKLFYTDPNSPATTTPIFDKILTPDTLSQTTNGVVHFTVKYGIAKTSQKGQYTFQLSQSGNPNVGTANLFVISATCPTGQNFDTTQNKCITPTTTTSQNNQQQQNQQTQQQLQNQTIYQQQFAKQQQQINSILNSLNATNNGKCIIPALCSPSLLTSLDATNTIATILQPNLIFIIIALIVVGVAYHIIDTQRGGKGLQPQVFVE